MSSPRGRPGGAEKSHDVLRVARRPPLDPLLAPKTVALVGATERAGSVGRAVLENLGAFGGKVFPVNPGHATVLGRTCLPRLADAPDPVDLAVVVTPAASVPGVIRDCVDAGVQGAVILSAGFREIGANGAALEREVLAEARRGRIRLVGPNCLGVMSPHVGLNATFAADMAQPGSVAFISQSGALCTAILDWSFREKVGFSAFVSVGSMLDVGWGDLIDYFGDDPNTRSIVCYMESVDDARSFLSAAREVALSKPIIAIKVGRSEVAARAAASHTGALTGSDEVLDAAFRRAGVLRVDRIDELFDMAELLAKQPRPRGPRLSIVTNAGGPGVLATDALIRDRGRLAELSPETHARLDAILPAHWSHGNPVDVLGDADADRYFRALEIVHADPGSDGLLVILAPQKVTDPRSVAERVRAFAAAGKPLLASWMGDRKIADGEAVLNDAGIPTFRYPDAAAHAFALMWRYSDDLHALYETPLPRDPRAGKRATPDTRPRIAARLDEIAASGRTLLTEVESKQVLAAYGIPTVETRSAGSEEAAVAAARELGFPVVLKLLSETVTHKTDVGGVQLGIRNARGVQQAWRAIARSMRERAAAVAPGHERPRGAEFLGVSVQPMVSLEGTELILGSSVDAQFGPVLLFGSGGRLVEVFRDRALGLPPLTATLARRIMERTRIYGAVRGVRGRKPVDLAALEQLFVRFAELVVEQRRIAEIEVNPLLAAPEQLLALDARIVLQPAAIPEEALPRTAIRPYPTQYVTPWTLRDGTPVVIRPVRPEDEPLVVRFHERLSERSVRYRYFAPLRPEQRNARERLIRLCFIDYDRDMALVVERLAGPAKQPEIIGVGRLNRLHHGDEAEFALTIADEWQGRGLGTLLLARLVEVARWEGLARIVGTILPDNHEMLRVARKVGFTVELEPGAAEYRAQFPLRS